MHILVPFLYTIFIWNISFLTSFMFRVLITRAVSYTRLSGSNSEGNLSKIEAFNMHGFCMQYKINMKYKIVVSILVTDHFCWSTHTPSHCSTTHSHTQRTPSHFSTTHSHTQCTPSHCSTTHSHTTWYAATTSRLQIRIELCCGAVDN